MNPSAGAAATYVVGLDRAEVLRRRRTVRRTQSFAIWWTVISFGVLLGILVAVAITMGSANGLWFFVALIVVAMIPVVVTTEQSRRRLAASKRWFAAAELPPFAMRMTAQALELGCEGAPEPIVLPWNTVLGFRLRRRFGQQVLELALAPGVTASTAGIRGADQPAASAMLWPPKRTKAAGFYGVASLDQPVEAIDQALRSFTAGRVTIAR